MKDFRWIVTIIYKLNNGPADVEYHLEEISELDEIIESGPHWDTIKDIHIVLNPKRKLFDGTVEQAEKL